MKTKKAIARAARSVLGDRRYRSLQGERRPSRSALLGPLADPGRVHDPMSDGTPLYGYVPQKERDAIVPVYDPEFVPAGSIDWSPSDMVIGIASGDEVRAYPVGALNKREMVLDRIDDIPVLVSWCPRCGTGMVHRREINGEEIILGNQGALYNEAMTWWDHETGSVWSQPLGAAIAGPLEGCALDPMPATVTTWRAWTEEYPETLALKMRTRPGHYQLADLTIAVSILGETTAYPISIVRHNGVVNDEVGAMPVAVVIDPRNEDRWSVFSRTVDDMDLTFERQGASIVDVQTNTSWHPWTGDASNGPLFGKTLTQIPAFTVLPKDVPSIWPNGHIWSEHRKAS